MVSEAELESGVVTRRGIEIIKGDRCHVWDKNGKKYLDMGASYGVCNVGHCNPKVIEAVRKQMDDIIYVSSSYDNPARKAIMEKLISISPPGMSRVFLCNSGTEANEAALKFALKHTGRKKLVAAKRAFHGRTLGSLSLTFNPSHREGVEDKLYPVDFVNFGSVEDLAKAVSEETAAVILEPIQGEGGVHVPPEGYLREARRICDEKGALLIIDEVQTGLCRTGRMFATDYDGISPDILTVGKSLGGGLPIAAAVLNKKLGEVPKGSHGSTFGGNPIACAAGKAALDFMTEEGLDRCAVEKGERFIRGLREINNPQIREARGKGMMIGLELKTKAGPFLTSLLDGGITAVPTGATIIRFLPPLVISDEEIEQALSTISEVLNGKSG